MSLNLWKSFGIDGINLRLIAPDFDRVNSNHDRPFKSKSRDSFDAMLEAAAEVLSPQEMVQWHHRMENCENLSQGAEVTTQMIGRPNQFL